jgi:hypothetical protein
VDFSIARERAEAAFIKRFGGREGHMTFTELQAGLRVTDPHTGAWIDYAISGNRIRAIGMRGPEQASDRAETRGS